MRETNLVGALRRLWSDRRFVAKAGLVGAMVATVIAVATPARYESTTRLMPLYYIRDQCFFMDLAILLHTMIFAAKGYVSSAQRRVSA